MKRDGKATRELDDVLREAAEIILQRAECAASGLLYVEKGIALKLAGAAAAQFGQMVIEKYEGKTDSAVGFEKGEKQ